MNFDGYTLVFLNGDPPHGDRIRNLIKEPARVVCADGGTQKALATGYVPHLIVGDLDSLDVSNELPRTVEIVRVPGQDNTDFEKTLDLMIDRGMNNFLVVAFSGGRIDQTLANIQIAFEYSRRCSIVLADDDFVLVPVTETFTSKLTVSTTISIIPMADNTTVSTEGLTYELSQSVLSKGGHGISNKSDKETVSVTVHEGGILLMINDA